MVNIHYKHNSRRCKNLYILSYVIHGERMTIGSERCEPVNKARHHAYEHTADSTHDQSYFHIQWNRLHLNVGTYAGASVDVSVSMFTGTVFFRFAISIPEENKIIHLKRYGKQRSHAGHH